MIKSEIDLKNFEKEMQSIYAIRDASMDLYEACLAIKAAFEGDGGHCFNAQERWAFNLVLKALERAES